MVVLITDGFTKLPGAIPTKKTSSDHVAETVMNAWIVPDGTLEGLLINNGSKYAGNVFNVVYVSLQTHLLTTATYHPKTNE